MPLKICQSSTSRPTEVGVVVAQEFVKDIGTSHKDGLARELGIGVRPRAWKRRTGQLRRGDATGTRYFAAPMPAEDVLPLYALVASCVGGLPRRRIKYKGGLDKVPVPVTNLSSCALRHGDF